MDSASDEDSMYTISDDADDTRDLEIKPPQAKISKYSQPAHTTYPGRETYSSSHHRSAGSHLSKTHDLRKYALKYEESLSQEERQNKKHRSKNRRRHEDRRSPITIKHCPNVSHRRSGMRKTESDRREAPVEEDSRRRHRHHRHHHHSRRSEKENNAKLRSTHSQVAQQSRAVHHSNFRDTPPPPPQQDHHRCREEEREGVYRKSREYKSRRHKHSSREGAGAAHRRSRNCGGQTIAETTTTTTTTKHSSLAALKEVGSVDSGGGGGDLLLVKDKHGEDGRRGVSSDADTSSDDETSGDVNSDDDDHGTSSGGSEVSDSGGSSNDNNSNASSDGSEYSSGKSWKSGDRKANNVDGVVIIEDSPAAKLDQPECVTTTTTATNVADSGGGNGLSDDEQLQQRSKVDNIILPAYFPAIEGCRSVEEFKCENRIAEGTFGVVFRGVEKRTGQLVALKRLKMEREREGFPITSLREINTLLKAQHPNIVTVREIVVGSNMDKIYIVMEYIEYDLKALMEMMKAEKKKFKMEEAKCLMVQLLSAVNHMHDNWILHRDLKTSNLLISRNGVLKVGDFGLAREYGSPLKRYTSVVVTLWYRAPELLLGYKEYSTYIDMWSVGCICAEILRLDPLFPGKSEIDQIKRIFKVFGSPEPDEWPQYLLLPAVRRWNLPTCRGEGMHAKLKSVDLLSNSCVDFIESLLCYNPKSRITAEKALQHGFFGDYPLPVAPSNFRTWPTKRNRLRENQSPKAPAGGQNYEELELENGVLMDSAKNSASYSLKSTFTLKF